MAIWLELMIIRTAKLNYFIERRPGVSVIKVRSARPAAKTVPSKNIYSMFTWSIIIKVLNKQIKYKDKYNKCKYACLL